MAFHDVNPVAPTHILLIPSAHVSSMNSVLPAHADLMGRLLALAPQLAKQQGIADDGYRLVINTGWRSGQSVPHVHIHLLGGRHLHWPPG